MKRSHMRIFRGNVICGFRLGRSLIDSRARIDETLTEELIKR
jgi:hypothetical protein